MRRQSETLLLVPLLPIFLLGMFPMFLIALLGFFGLALFGVLVICVGLASSNEAHDNFNHDVIVHGYSDQVDPRAYEDAGSTWWLEDIHDLRDSFDELLQLVEAGPPVN